MTTFFKLCLSLTTLIALMASGCQESKGPESKSLPSGVKFENDWRSLKQHTTPQWLRDGKFGIYTHWGIYASCYG